jgi:predicted DNA-binding protein (UPF0251 family)
MTNARRRERALAYAQEQRETWALALADSDGEILHLRDDEKLTLQRIATRLGISRVAAGYRVRAARKREVIRQTLPAKVQ